MTKEDLLPWLFILIGGLVAAFVTFFLLDSTAQTASGIPLTGGIVGALVSWSALTNIFLQIRRSNRTSEKLQALNNELQSKVIQRSPLPNGYEREVDERNGLVLARPAGWRPRAGVIFSFSSDSRPDDLFVAEFSVSQLPLPRGQSSDDIYDQISNEYHATTLSNGGLFTEETVQVGGTDDTAGVRSRKCIMQLYALVQTTLTPPIGAKQITWEYISDSSVHSYAGRFVEDAFKKRRLTGLDLPKLAALRSSVKSAVDTHINRWTVDPYRGLRRTVELCLDSVMTQVETSSSIEPDVADVPGGGSADASKGASSLTQPQGEYIQDVVAVNRAVVITHFTNLNRVFVFDFVDDVGDFSRSSDYLETIVRSVRFLQ
jgi:hypothetical protein